MNETDKVMLESLRDSFKFANDTGLLVVSFNYKDVADLINRTLDNVTPLK